MYGVQPVGSRVLLLPPSELALCVNQAAWMMADESGECGARYRRRSGTSAVSIPAVLSLVLRPF